MHPVSLETMSFRIHSDLGGKGKTVPEKQHVVKETSSSFTTQSSTYSDVLSSRDQNLLKTDFKKLIGSQSTTTTTQPQIKRKSDVVFDQETKMWKIVRS